VTKLDVSREIQSTSVLVAQWKDGWFREL